LILFYSSNSRFKSGKFKSLEEVSRGLTSAKKQNSNN